MPPDQVTVGQVTVDEFESVMATTIVCPSAEFANVNVLLVEMVFLKTFPVVQSTARAAGV